MLLSSSHPSSPYFNKKWALQHLRTIRDIRHTRERFWRCYPYQPFRWLAVVEQRIKEKK